MESQKKFDKSFSIEFFPPKSEEARDRLHRVRDKLMTLNPHYVSVTFGAGGSTQQGTVETVQDMLNAGLDAAPHLSCITSSKDEIRELVNNYRDMGVKRIVALRGDVPSGMRGPSGEFRYANELVEFLRSEYGDTFHLEVGAYPEFHPQAPSASADIDNFARKVKAGADVAITQYFFNADAYYRFIDQLEKRGVDIPVIPGIMPIINWEQLKRFSGMCGAELPRWMSWRAEELADKDDKEGLQAFGHEVVGTMAEELLAQGAPGIHFYSMNQAKPTMKLWQDLNIRT
jgi:methylenetetrahydrofolate reductase (NADPH)